MFGRSGPVVRAGGAAYLHTLINLVPTAANAGYYAQIVAERATLRRLVTAGTRIVQMGYDTASGSANRFAPEPASAASLCNACRVAACG